MAQPVHTMLARTLVSQQNEVSALVLPTRLRSADWCASRSVAACRAMLRVVSGASLSRFRLDAMLAVAASRTALARSQQNTHSCGQALALIQKSRRTRWKTSRWGVVKDFAGANALAGYLGRSVGASLPRPSGTSAAPDSVLSER